MKGERADGCARTSKVLLGLAVEEGRLGEAEDFAEHLLGVWTLHT